MPTLKKKALICLFLPIVILLSLRFPVFLGHLWGNAGWIVLSRAVAEEGAVAQSRVFLRAEGFLRRATGSATRENRSAWRGLGYTLAAQGNEDEAVVAWQNAGRMGEELIQWGEQARKVQRYEEALRWYRRAAQVEQQLGDPWYYVGLAYEGLERWGEALTAFQRGLSLPLAAVGRSDVHYQVGWLEAHRLEPIDLPGALATFDLAIACDDFVIESREVQAHYQRAEVLRQLELGEEALREYEWVVARQPEHYWAWVHLGGAYWQVVGDVVSAEDAFKVAISLDPDAKWAYRGLAQFYQGLGRTAEAVEMYRRVQEIDPLDTMARRELEKLAPADGE